MKRHMLSIAGTIFTVMAFLCLVGCEKSPMPAIARFTYEIEYGPFPKQVKFWNDSRNSNSIVWDFGNDTLIYTSNPWKVFDCDHDTINVRLSAYGDGGGTTVTKTIALYDSVCRITGARVLSLPPSKSNGDPWDPSDGPDVMMTVADTPLTFTPFFAPLTNSYTYYNISQFPFSTDLLYYDHEDVKFPNPITTGKGIRYLQFWDQDSNSYELMGTIKFDITSIPCNSICGMYELPKDSLGTVIQMKLNFF